MKNVHLISTIKPSKLIRDFNNKLLVNYNNVQNLRDEYDFQHLYITSDEVITEGDYIFSKKTNNLFKADDLEHLESHNMIEDFDKSFYINSKYAKKIILTTDVDLIKDGVQSIDNEFLEWFVKNPSCEEVKWSAYPISPNGNIVATNRPYPFEGLISNFKIEYKIIIPKEEPLTKLEIAKNIAAIGIGGEKAPKQETLEEVATKLLWKKYPYHSPLDSGYWQDMFIEGAKWQMERSYIEEEVIWAILVSSNKKFKNSLEAKEWWNNFKSK
jgi:hypothetical protein